MIRRLFVEHPATVGETYLQHLAASASFGASMLFGAAACFVHALVPALCVKTGSSVIANLHRRMVTHRASQPRLSEPADV